MRPYTMKTRACDTDREVSSPFKGKSIQTSPMVKIAQTQTKNCSKPC